MYKISDLFEDYKTLQKDYDLLQTIKKSAKRRLVDSSCVEELIRHNCTYRSHIEKWLMNHLPETAAEMQKWSAEDVGAWLDFLIAYPSLYYGQEEKLIGLVWSLDNTGKLSHEEKVGRLLTHPNLVGYVADYRNESTASILKGLIDKYATLSQAVDFQNRVDLDRNDIR